jgi:proteasome lid subunit RPN8/RPN11
MTMVFGAGLVAAMGAHGAEGFPYEVVGALVGSGDRLDRAVRLENENETLPERRYDVGPKQIAAVERSAMREGLGILGFYHTHPDHPAVPSETDIGHAVPGYLYAILSVMAGEPAALTLWRLADSGDRMEPVPYVIEEI